jgi:DNA integrity scanning protein DisA with diadenylate cyclase activity
VRYIEAGRHSDRGGVFYFSEKECCDMAEMRESNKLVVKVDVDVSDALKGLKALRREANKTLKALEKLQQKANEMNIFEYSSTVTIQDAMDNEQFAEEIRKEIEEHKKEMEERRKAFRERFEAARERISKYERLF